MSTLLKPSTPTDKLRPGAVRRVVKRVAFQGELGAFSQQAIRQLLGPSVIPVPYERFDKVFAALKAGQVDAAVVPLENTLAGSVHENFDLLLQHPFEITAETSVRVIHNLIVRPGVTAKSIRRVYSHPVALSQCLKFFDRHPQMERVPFYDTAGSVKVLMESTGDATGTRPGRSDAAIASELAASIYGASILQRGIEDNRQNFTRFFLLEPAGSPARPIRGDGKYSWKTSLVFSTRNVPGALFRALGALALRDLNLIKIESRPLRGKPWEYLFFLDIVGHHEDVQIRNALSHLAEIADFLRVLGSYRAAPLGLSSPRKDAAKPVRGMANKRSFKNKPTNNTPV
jgi:prephenate dehydratase